MNKDVYMPFYFEWGEKLSELSDAEYGRLVRATLAFSMGIPCEVKLSKRAMMAYGFMTSVIYRHREKCRGGGCGEKKEAASAENPPKPRTSEKKRKVFKRIERENATNLEEKKENQEKIPTKEDITANNREIDSTNLDFSPPSVNEVKNFFEKREFKSNPEEFFNFYTSNGWMVGSNPMKNWHSSAENWEIKAKRTSYRGDFAVKAEDNPHQSPDPPRYGDFDVHEAFTLAVKRSYEKTEDEED